MKRWPLVSSFVLFVALCASAAYWAIQFLKPPVRAVAAPPQAALSAPRLDAAAGLFGGQRSFATASNFQLKGVVAAGNPAESVAILAANGKPAQSVKTGAEVIPGVILKEVHPSYVLLSEGGVVKRVELPVRTKAEEFSRKIVKAPIKGQSQPDQPKEQMEKIMRQMNEKPQTRSAEQLNEMKQEYLRLEKQLSARP